MAHTTTHWFNRRHASDDEEHQDSDRQNDRPANQRVFDEAAQRSRYGGLNLGAAFYGWIVATGIGTILAAILTAAGSAIALASLNGKSVQSAANSGTAQTIGITGGILLLIALVVAYYAGGYVAGRLSRFDGARQGLGTWLFGILAALVLAAVGAILGSQYNVLQGLNLPSLPSRGSLTTGGLITSLVALVLTLIAAIAGGKAGERYHRKIDRVGAVG